MHMRRGTRSGCTPGGLKPLDASPVVTRESNPFDSVSRRSVSTIDLMFDCSRKMFGTFVSIHIYGKTDLSMSTWAITCD